MSRCPVPLRVAPSLLAAALLAGCTTVGPDFHAPPAPRVARYTAGMLPQRTASAPGHLGAPQQWMHSAAVDREWWKSFASPRLDALVQQALRNNPTLEAARATLRQAQETYAAQAGSTLYPTISAKLGASRSETNGASVGTSSSQRIYNLYNAGIAVNYNLDLFGGNRRALEALAAQADYQAYQLAGARLSLAGNVVTTAFAQAQLRAQVAATRAIARAQAAELAITVKRLQLGAASRVDVLSLRTQYEQTLASLPPLRNKLQQADHLLALLVGQAPGQAHIPRFRLSDFRLPPQLPLVVPSQLLRQRPDVQASTALLHAATAQYGVAISSLYPQINLSATLSTEALTTGALFGPGSTIWNLAGQLAQPLFNAGLHAAKNAAEANLQAAGANYRATVLQALRNVADALRQLDNDAQALRAQAAADSAAQQSLHLVEQQYHLGAASYLQLLTAQQQAQNARIGLLAAQAARLADTAALYQAMGGGVLAHTTTGKDKPA